MESFVLKCPYCGADLLVNEESSQIVCPYCKNRIGRDANIHDSRRMGFEFECGRMEAQLSENQHLSRRVGLLIEQLSAVIDLRSEEDALLKQINELENKCENNKRTAIKLCIICIAIGVLPPILSNTMFFAIPISLLLAVICSLPYFFNMRQLSNLYLQYTDIGGQIEWTFSQISQEDIQLIPREYWEKEAMDYIYRSLTSLRAMTMHQAITQYEAYKNQKQEMVLRQKELKLQEELLREQKYQRKLQEERFAQRKEKASPSAPHH